MGIDQMHEEELPSPFGLARERERGIDDIAGSGSMLSIQIETSLEAISGGKGSAGDEPIRFIPSPCQ